MTSPVQILLQRELDNRRLRNPAYSLRAFARDLDVSLTALSDCMNGLRQLSKKNMTKIAERLRLSESERGALLRAKTERVSRKLVEKQRRLLEEDTFHLIADWYYLAILNLAETPNCKSNSEWVAKRLAISKDEASKAIERLKRLGLVNAQGGKLLRTSEYLTTTTDVPSSAIRKHHLHNLKLAENSLLNDDVSRREFGSATMAIDLAQLPKAKELLLETRKKISELLTKGTPQEVYVLSFQLFPVSKQEEEK